MEVFRVDLTDPDLSVERSAAIIAADEVQRGDRFRHARDRERYFASRAALRLALSRLLGCAPQKVTLVKGEFGKPSVATAPELQFSLSRSGETALIAISGVTPVGIDVEKINGSPGSTRLPVSLLPASESSALLALNPAVRQTAFLRCWVRREALLKATGLGLSRGLREVTIPISDQALTQGIILDVPGHGRWRVVDVPFDAGYLAALAAKADFGWIPCLRDFVVR